MKITVAQSLRFLQVAIGESDRRGVLADYFEDLLGLDVPPTVDVATTILEWFQQGKSDMEQTPIGRARIAGMKRFVAALRGLADAMDPAAKNIHPNSEPFIDLEKEDDDPA